MNEQQNETNKEFTNLFDEQRREPVNVDIEKILRGCEPHSAVQLMRNLQGFCRNNEGNKLSPELVGYLLGLVRRDLDSLLGDCTIKNGVTYAPKDAKLARL